MAATLGILQTGSTPGALIDEHGDYPVMFRAMFEALLGAHRAGPAFRVYRVMDGELPGRADACDAWLITGSRHSVLESLPWMRRLAGFIRDLADRDGRLAGICFGHQIMAAALGGRVDRSGGWVLGRQRYRLATPSGGRDSIGLNAFHQDQVVSPPDSARVLGTSDTGPYSILEYGASMISTQAHPEFDNRFLEALIDWRLKDELSASRLAAIGAGLESPPDSERMARMILDRLAI
jgi:GMP synthase (glutamine-hydrolysing)